MNFGVREFLAAVSRLPEAEKLFATLAYWEKASDSAVRRELGLSPREIDKLRLSVERRLAPVVPVPAREVGRLRRRALERLVAECRVVTGRQLDQVGRLRASGDSVVSTVPPDALRAAETDVRKGDGGELRGRSGQRPSFHSAYSSCALAVSTFGPWRLDPGSLSLFGLRGFERLQFEAKCPIKGVIGRAPNLDALAESRSGVLAIESKLTEYMTSKKVAKFRAPYSDAVKRLADPTWAAAFARLQDNPEEFRFLNAAQLVKHYLGLRSCFPEQQVTLAYLYWEPLDASRYPLFQQHRAEIASFGEKLDDPNVSLVSLSYPELWRLWRHRSSPAWLHEHVMALEPRYGITLGD